MYINTLDFIDYLNSGLTKEEIEIISCELFNSLKFHIKDKFVIDVGDIYKSLDFNSVTEAVTFIKNNYIRDEDFIIPKDEEVILSRKCFKEIINKQESDVFRHKYNKYEEINCKYMITKYNNKQKLSNAAEKEKQILNSGNLSIEGVYWIINPILQICKFGSSKNIYNRFKTHKQYLGEDFFLDNVIETEKYIEVENTIRIHVNATYKKYTEIIMYQSYKDLKNLYIETEIQNKMLESEEMYKSYASMYNKQIKLNLLEKKNKEIELDILKSKIKLEKINKLSVVETYNPLYDFLSLHTRYKHGNILLMESIREKYNLWGSTDLTKLNNYIFKEVNKEYIVETLKLCKNCWKHCKKGCCNEYNRDDRTCRKIVRNIEFCDVENN